MGNLIGWVRLHRKLLDNKVFKYDPTAWRTFEVLLLLTNKDTGVWEGGRFQLAEYCQQKPITTYKSLKRLEKSKMVTLASNNRYTTISICKWGKYQSKDNTNEEQRSNNEVTTEEQQSNTPIRKTRIKNKELIIKNNSLKTKAQKKVDYGKMDINEIITYGGLVLKTWSDDRKAVQNLLQLKKLAELLPDYLAVERVKKLLDLVATSRTDRYAPRISSYRELVRDHGRLFEWLARQRQNKGKVGMV